MTSEWKKDVWEGWMREIHYKADTLITQGDAILIGIDLVLEKLEEASAPKEPPTLGPECCHTFLDQYDQSLNYVGSFCVHCGQPAEIGERAD